MKQILFYLSILFSTLIFGQEICDNAIDDDGDGLIDLNDEDCECSGYGVELESLIPNPSFEETDCCPYAGGQLTCASTWIQASIPTTDYYNTCGAYFGAADFPLPGGGYGYVGFISNTPYWSEHVGACLPVPMEEGTTYVLNLYIDCQTGVDIDTLTLSLYGTPNCDDLPWDGTNCPLGIGDWTLLNSQFINFEEGPDTWREITLTFTPPTDIYAVAIGGTCYESSDSKYFFLDELTLIDEIIFFGLALESYGSWCTGDLVLSAETELEDGSWQWYKDGVALLGEEGNVLSPIPYGPGVFTVVYNNDEHCLSDSYTTPPHDLELDFEMSEEYCAPGVTTFINATEMVPGVSFMWLFGDGEWSEEEAPEHSYMFYDTYDVSLIAEVEEDSLCNDTLTQPFTVWPPPMADFDFTSPGLFTWAGNQVVCENQTINFEDLSSVPEPSDVVSWFWDFGDGTTSEEENPVHVFEGVGVRTITLTVETEFGCEQTHTRELYIAAVRPDFTVENGCALEEINFVNTSDPLFPVEIAGYEWDFGDGGTADGESPVYAYDAPGIYEVELIAESESGCLDTISYPIEVYPLPEPDFEFEIDGLSSVDGGTGGCYTSEVFFFDSSTVDPPATITSWLWDFGDGETSTEANPTHLYETWGEYTVTLTVISSYDCENTYSREIMMTNGQAFLSSDTTICQNGIATVWAESSDGSLHSYNWSIPESDEGATQTLDDITEDTWVYVSSTNEAGCISPVDSILITIFDPISLEISAYDTVCIGETSEVTVTATGGNGDYNYAWTANGEVLPDNSPEISSIPNITTEYCVIVSDGCETDLEEICIRTYVPEIPSFTADTTQGCEPQTINFTDLTGPEAELNQSNWNINGEVLMGNPASYTFEEAGTYSVGLDVLSPEGCISNSTIYDYITIYPLPTPVLYATPNPTTFLNTLVKVVNISPNINSSFSWNLPGGSPEWAASDSIVEVVYPELISNNYNVSIIETTQFGCVDSSSLTIIINNEQIIYAPNTFTPDGDLYNQTWGVHIAGIDVYDFHLTMFNRWGEIIWESYDPTAQWDGTYGETPVKDGVYVWVIHAKDVENDQVHEFKGTVTVLR